MEFGILLIKIYFLQSAAELLGCVPDIACFAKLMTGGIIPLAATLATDAVFDSFTADSKVLYCFSLSLDLSNALSIMLI